MKCNYHPPKLTREEQQDMASMKSTLPYIDRLQVARRQWCEVKEEDTDESIRSNERR